MLHNKDIIHKNSKDKGDNSQQTFPIQVAAFPNIHGNRG